MRYCKKCDKTYSEDECGFYGESNPHKGMLYCPVCGRKTERHLIDLKHGDIVCEKCSYRGGYYETNATWFDCINEESAFYLNRVDKYFTCSKAEKDKLNNSKKNIGEILADNLKWRRENLNLSYKKLSDISGVPADCIEKIECTMLVVQCW